MTYRLGEVALTSQSDERLVKLARVGHERAFAVIVERYRPELYALARRLSSDGKGEDIVQQAFLSAFAALRSGAEVEHLRGWLYQIVRNLATRSRAPLCLPLDGAQASGDSVEDIVQQRLLALNALAELARLPNRQRQAMVGTALDGRGRAEIAGSMGVSEGAVRQLVHRARARLRTVVTAVTPWPLARWLAGARPGSGGAVDVAATAAAGAGAVSSGGVALKLGIVLASGAIATGVAAVDVHVGASRQNRATPQAATPAFEPHAPRRHDHVVTVAGAPAAVVRVDESRAARGALTVGRPGSVEGGQGGDGTAPERHPRSRTTTTSRGPDRRDGGGARESGGSPGGTGSVDGGGTRDGGGTGHGGGTPDGSGSPSGGDGQGSDAGPTPAPQAVVADDGRSNDGGGSRGHDGGSSNSGPGSDSSDGGSASGSTDGGTGSVSGPVAGSGDGSSGSGDGGSGSSDGGSGSGDGGSGSSYGGSGSSYGGSGH
jgi:RNA polymerase sigma factor (sigma-70 family)